jgi:hypothetical protein
MNRLRLILVVALFGFAAQSAQAQNVACTCDYDELVAQECVATGLCESTAVVVEAVDVAVCDEETMADPVHGDLTETPAQEASSIQQYGMWFFVLIIFVLPAIILFIILRAKRRKNR